MTEQYDTIVIGGGQAGLATGHELATRGRDFVILDALEHVGDAWRNRWDSLVLFSPEVRQFTTGSYTGPDHMRRGLPVFW